MEWLSIEQHHQISAKATTFLLSLVALCVLWLSKFANCEISWYYKGYRDFRKGYCSLILFLSAIFVI